MDKKKIYMLIGLVIVIAAIVLLINMRNSSAPVVENPAGQGQVQNQAASSEPASAVIVVARKDIAKGTPIGPDAIKPKKVLTNELSQDSIENPDAVVGKIATVDIIMGEQITTSKIAMRPEQQQLSAKIPEGKRAMIIPIDKISSLEGMVKPADKVDIVGIFPQPRQGVDGKMYSETVIVPMFENVQVLAVGNNLNARSGNENYGSMTFALTTEESSVLMYALQLGQIRLLLRSPLDTGVTNRKPVNLSTIYEKLFSIDRAAQARAQQEQQEQQTQEQSQRDSKASLKAPAVEVFTGGQTGK